MLDMGFIPDIRKIVAAAPGPTPDPPLLGDVLGRDPAPLASEFLSDPATVEVARRNTAAESVEQVLYPVDRERKEDLLHPPDPARPDGAGPRLHPDEAGGQPAGVVPRSTRRRRRRDPQRPQPARADPGPRGLQERRGDLPRGDRRRVARPRHRGAARTSSTSSCRSRRRTTSTGSGGPGGPASPASPSRSSASDEVELLTGVQRLLKRRSRTGSSRGSCPTGRSQPRPIRGFGRDGTSALDGRGHHAHHKPIRTRTAGRRAS